MGPAYSLHGSVCGEQPGPLMLGLRSKSYIGRPGELIASCTPPTPLDDAQPWGSLGEGMGSHSRFDAAISPFATLNAPLFLH
jgi:hypothetical protein